jgi:hypothetical protein
MLTGIFPPIVTPLNKETLVMGKKCRLGLIVGLLTLMAAPGYSAVITQWAFENPPNPIAVNNSPAPSAGAGTASSIGMDVYPTPNIGVTTDDVLNGVAGDTGGNGNADLSQIWRVRAQAAPGGGAANGWSSLAPIGTQGAVFAASTKGFNAINVSFDWYATNQGEANLQLRYTNDGTTFTNVPITLNASDAGLAALVNVLSPNTVIGSYVHITGGGQGWFPGLTATIVDPLAANNPKFAIEMVNASTDGDNVAALNGTPLNNTSGNWRFDNIAISGTAVPEPCSIVLAGIALTWLSVSVARRR